MQNLAPFWAKNAANYYRSNSLGNNFLTFLSKIPTIYIHMCMFIFCDGLKYERYLPPFSLNQK